MGRDDAVREDRMFSAAVTVDDFLAAYVSESPRPDCEKDMRFRAYLPSGERVYGSSRSGVEKEIVRAIRDATSNKGGAA